MARPFRLFREYEFFGILLPGLASVIFLYLLLPKSLNISFPAGIVFVGVFAFVFGQALHSIALFIEGLPEIVARISGTSWSHRKKFEKELNDPEYVTRDTIDDLRREGAQICSTIEYRDQFAKDTYSERESQSLYLTLRSYLHTRNHSRSRNIKAMYAFCRNTFVLLFGLIPLYLVYGFLDSSPEDIGLLDIGFIDRPGKYLEFFPSYTEFLKAVIPLAFLGAVIFLVATLSYQRFYVQYLISDFLVVRNHDDSDEYSGNTKLEWFN